MIYCHQYFMVSFFMQRIQPLVNMYVRLALFHFH